MSSLLGKNPILTELRYIHNLLDECLGAMDQITDPKIGNIFMRLIFPAGPFIQQKTEAKAAAAILLNIDARLHEMLELLEEKLHPNLPLIHHLVETDFNEIAMRLVDLPERVQYIIPQIEKERKKVEMTIMEIEQY